MINTILEELNETHLLHKLFRRFHYRGNVDDAVHDMYLAWMNNPEGVIKAYTNGYLLQYCTSAVKKRVAKYFYIRREELIDDLKIEL